MGDLLVSDRGDGARALGRRPRRPALGQRQRGDPVARRRGAPGPVLRLARAAHGRPGARAGDRRRAARARGRDGLQQLGGRRPGSRARGRPGAGRPLPARAQLERGRGRRRAPRPAGRASSRCALGALRSPTPGGSLWDLETLRRLEAEGARGLDAGLGGDPARRAESLLQRLGGGRARDVGAGRGDPRRAARARGPAPAPPRVRGRPRAHRHGLGLADGRDPPQARPHGREPARAHRPLPRLSLRRLLGPALRLARAGRPGALLAGRRGDRRRALGGRRRRPGSSRTATSPTASR